MLIRQGVPNIVKPHASFWGFLRSCNRNAEPLLAGKGAGASIPINL